jgi:ACT domain-containing protein
MNKYGVDIMSGGSFQLCLFIRLFKCEERYKLLGSFNIVDLNLKILTIKGLLDETPAYMSFDVTSTEQQNIDDFINLLKTLVRENDLVLVSNT